MDTVKFCSISCIFIVVFLVGNAPRDSSFLLPDFAVAAHLNGHYLVLYYTAHSYSCSLVGVPRRDRAFSISYP